MNQLSPEQSYAFAAFRRGENLFITGPGGTGKTRLIHYILNSFGEERKHVQVCAMTGCASLLLGFGAQTLHSWSGIKLAKGDRNKIINGVLRNKSAMSSWRKARVLFVDEVSMMSLKIFELCDDIGKIVRKNSAPFGGIQIVFTGDFYQLPPVGTGGEPDTDAFCFESSRWKQIFKPENHIQLETMFRQKDPLYIAILGGIRRGELSEEHRQILMGRVKREYIAEEHEGCVLTKLFPIRAKAEYVNQAQYSKIEEPERMMKCIRNVSAMMYVDSSKMIEPEEIRRCAMLSAHEKEMYLDSLVANTACVENLGLKIGTAVMCTVNVDMDSGICNGSQGVVVDFVGVGSSPIVKFANGVKRIIERHTWQSEEYPCLTVSQYPLCLAWALTIHKIQGATMAMAEMDLGNSVFEYGQTYVALSRIQSLEGLYLSAFRSDKIKANPKVREFYDAIPKIDIAQEVVDAAAASVPVTVPNPNPDPTVKKIDFAAYHYLENTHTVQIKKQATDKVSLEMFLAGKSIDEIAESRRLKSATVVEHLVTNFPHEGLSYDQFMTEDEYVEIKNAYDVFGENVPMKVIKDSVSASVSYTNIKIVRNLIYGNTPAINP